MQAKGKVGFLKQLKHSLERPLLRQDLMAGVTYLLPSAVVLLAFVIVPVVMALVLSFSKWELLSVEGRKFIGLGNYTFLLTNKEFWNTIKNTIYFGAVKIPADIILSLLVAMLLNGSIRGLSFYRTIYFLPVITSTVAVSAVWRYMYDPNFGFANVVLKWLGVGPQTWLYNPKLAMISVILVALWKGLGYDIIIYLAGLQSIPRMYYEAASIDGANAWQKFWKITWPLLSPVTYFIFIMSIINSFKVFSQIHVLTPGGGPLKSTEVMVLYIYRQAFQEFRFGRAAAAAFILFGFVTLVTQFQRKVIEPRVHY